MSSINNKVKEIRQKVSNKDKQQLLNKENVHSVGIGFEEGKAKKAENVCLTVRVSNKKAKEDLKDQDIVPSQYLSIETDVIEEDIPSIDNYGESNPGNDDELQTQVRETEFNTLSGGVAGSGNGDATVPGSARLIDEDGDIVTITNRHVACNDGDDCTGDAIVQPTNNQTSGRQVGTTKRIGNFNPNGPDEDNVDVAVIEMDESVASISNRYYGLSQQQDFKKPELGQRVVNTGRRTGFISGEITELDATSNVDFGFDTITFTGVARYDVPTDGGDSGSITCTVNSDGEVFPVVCHFAGSSTTGVGMPFGKIQKYLGSLSTPTGNYTTPTSNSGIDLIEPFCYNVTTNSDNIDINFIVSNTGSSQFTDTIELLDENNNVIDSKTYSDISPGHFISDSFTINSDYDNSELTLQSSDHIDYVEVENVFSADYVPQIIDTNSPVTAGESLNVDIKVENTTNKADEEFLDFFIGGELEDFSEGFTFTDTQSFSFDYQTDENDIGNLEVKAETVNSEKSDTTTVNVEEEDAFFNITIDSVNSPVKQGENIQVDYTVQNTGSSGQSDISLAVDGSVENTNTSIQLDSNESVSQSLTWSTSTNDRGEYNLTVDADDVNSNSDSTTANVQKPATFNTNITETNSRVKLDNKLTVDVDIINNGDLDAEKEITFTVSDYEDSRFVYLNAGSVKSETFEWQTEDGDVGEYTAQIESEDDSDSQNIEIREPFPASFETSIVSFVSPVSPSSDLSIEYQVENTGEESDTQNIELGIEGSIENTESNVSLNGGEVYSSNFIYEVQQVEDEYSGAISSDDDSSVFTYEVQDVSGFDFPIIDQDWDNLALDDGTIVDEFGTYSVRIYPRDDTGLDTLDSQVENISYSPEVNSAKGISVDVEPLSALEGEDYLGGIVDLFVNNRPLFSGKIYKISTSSEEGTYYTLEAEPPAKELRNETINENTDNYLLSDYCAKTIDRFNEYDDEHFNLIDTSDESLTDIDKVDRGREATSDSATATYSNVGSDASNVDILYAKILVNGSVDITIDTSNSSYSETFASSEGTYGDWFKIEPSGLDSEQYDIEYSLDAGSVVYDWISITQSKVTRTLEPEVAEESRQQETVQDASTDAEWENILNLKDTDPYKVENGKLIPLKTAYVFEVEDDNFAINSINEDADYSGGEGEFIAYPGNSEGEVTFEYSIDIPYEMENWVFIVREDLIPEDSSDERVLVPEVTLTVNGTSNKLTVDGASFTPGLRWEEWGAGDYSFGSISGSTSIELEITGFSDKNTCDVDTDDNDDECNFYWEDRDEDDYGDWIWDVFAIIDERYYDGISDFDNTVHEDDGFLDEPHEYPQDSPAYIETSEINTGEIVEKAYLDIDTNDPDGLYELGVSFDSGDIFRSENNTTSIAKENSALSPSIITRFGTKSWEDDGARNDQTPRLGYSRQEIDLYDISVDTNNIEVLFDSDPSGNRLKVITDIIDNSRLYYRVEGSDIRIFGRGDKKTDVDLRKEDINSSVSIEDVYASCEVIGDDVTSGVIEADNAPDYVDRHKEIRDPDITNADDATRRARSFLEENSTIEYEGDITTLPTLAPLGEEIDGSIFGHGKDSFIESVRYGKRRTTIDVGRTKDLQSELLDLDRGVGSSRTRDTGV